MEVYRDIDIIKTWTLQGTLNFTRYFFKEKFKRKFVVGKHHVAIAKALDRVLAGESTRLIINIAPRYGKTELAVKNFIAMGLAINPKAKFIHLSYSDDLARDNSRGVQEILREDSYRRLFPGTKPTSVNTRKWFTTEGGGLYAVSSAGQVTGFGAGIVDEEKEEEDELAAEVEELASVSDGTFGGAIVIDDPIKPDDARSETVREKVNQKFETTIRNRVNSRKTPIIIIMQRLDEEDLCGYLMRLEPEEWEVLSLPAIEYDEQGNQRMSVMSRTTTANYIEVPLVFNYYQRVGEGRYVVLAAGPYVAYGISGKSVTKGDTSRPGSEKMYYEGKAFKEPGVKRFDAGLQVMLGYQFASSLIVGLETDLGVLPYNAAADRNISGIVSLSYRF